MKRSTDTGARDNTGHFDKVVSTSRTSYNAWCQGTCWEDPTVQKVMARAESMLNISLMNSETLQVLEYRPEQYYRTHHDLIHGHLQMPCGPRILTWFMYLMSKTVAKPGSHCSKSPIHRNEEGCCCGRRSWTAIQRKKIVERFTRRCRSSKGQICGELILH